MILKDWQSEKYCLAKDLKSPVVSTEENIGRRRGEQIDMEDGPLRTESGSDKDPGFPIKSIKYSLPQNIFFLVFACKESKKFHAF